MLVFIGIVVTVIVFTGVLFVNLSPQFGGSASKEQQKKYAKSPNNKDGKFVNLGGVKQEMSAGDIFKAIGGMFKSIPNALPKSAIQIQKTDSINIADYKSSKTRFIWFGHSAFLFQIEGKNILIDPMFSDVPAPHPLLGNKRFSKELPIEIEKLSKIDAVLISHDHYDHLDYESIKKLKHKVDKFFTLLGLSNHLKTWGVKEDKITELDWWQETTFENLTFVSTPSQHFSGRGLGDRDKTLWCSWIVKSENEKIFFSGDSGYGPHFKEIGNIHGPFDFAMMECGQYNELWSEIHMFPEETAQASIDIKAKKMMPIHWGAFKLAQHSWTDPIQRVVKKAEELNVALIIPEIGKSIILEDETLEQTNWWSKY
ncbi:MBL fold metallo-hydrolase [Tenacibaculum sp. M341]|nr:MBL fold metallo-hydrolase [Tenacibaculum sp. M341]TCI94137.1 MBL fold metallo-hydrolase [Tenacibaculum sp. M341]